MEKLTEALQSMTTTQKAGAAFMLIAIVALSCMVVLLLKNEWKHYQAKRDERRRKAAAVNKFKFDGELQELHEGVMCYVVLACFGVLGLISMYFYTMYAG